MDATVANSRDAWRSRRRATGGFRTMSRRPLDRLLLLMAYLGFVSLGLPDAALGIVWPSVRESFALPQGALGWPLAAAASGYVLSGMLAGRVLAAIGVGWLLGGSTLLVAVGVAGYALSPSASVFIGAACVVGWGSGAVDSGLNVYAAERFGPRHMAFLHAAYSVGAAVGAFTLSAFVAASRSWRDGYGLIALLLTALSVAFLATRKRWRSQEDLVAPTSPGAVPLTPTAPLDSATTVGTLSALRFPLVRLHALLFFVYSGVELGIGHWSYSILTRSRMIEPKAAALAVSSYWACLFVGRVLAGFSVDRLGTAALLRGGMLLAAAATSSFAALPLSATLSAVVLGVIGLAIAPLYPGLMSETPRRVGVRAAGHAVGFQVSAATAGAVLLPTLGGVVAEWHGLEFTAALVALTAILLVSLHELLLHRVGQSC
jgi:fucose permease